MLREDLNQAKSLSDGVYLKLKERIINGVYEEGFRLVETKLCEEFGVSRTPVREAISQLELDGLAKTLPNRETVVVAITQKDIEDIYDIRMRIEGLAARLAAENMSAEEMKELEEIMDLEEYHTERKHVDRVLYTDSRFHDCIYRGSKSKILIQTLSMFHEHIKRARNSSLAVEGRAAQALEEHEGIFQAIRQRNADLAEELAIVHIRNARESILKTFREE